MSKKTLCLGCGSIKNVVVEVCGGEKRMICKRCKMATEFKKNIVEVENLWNDGKISFVGNKE